MAVSLLDLQDIEQCVLCKEVLELLRKLSESKQFCEMLLINYVNQIEKENQTQFSAITVQMSENLSYVSFMGTDNKLIGWKENFNMCFILSVPAQKSAVKYLETVSASIDWNLIVGGHSKGGNLAMYVAYFCNEETRKRLA